MRGFLKDASIELVGLAIGLVAAAVLFLAIAVSAIDDAWKRRRT